MARRVISGDILLPKFQREFVWKRKQTRELLDSIAKGFPIGSLLLWQSRQELRSENRIADLEIKLPKPDYPVNYLLDGQQRLSTICGALHWNGSNPKSIWNLAYDLRRSEFIHLESLDDPPQHQVRMNRLSDAASYFKFVASLDLLAAPDKELLKLNAELLFNRFKDYKVAVVTLGDMSIQDVAPIFERINSTGTRLTIVDLMRAATWSPDFDLIDSIDEVRDVLTEKNFGSIDRKVLLRSVSAAVGGAFSAEGIDSLRKHDATALKAAMAATKQSFERAVDFLTTHIGIPHDGIVPYANQLVVLAEIFRQLPHPNASEFAAIVRWFWRTSASGYFSGWNTGMMARDQEAVSMFIIGMNDDVEYGGGQPTAAIWRTKQFRADGAHAKLLAIILGNQQPYDLLTGQRIDVNKALYWGNAKEFHHFFPKDYLKAQGVGKTAANCLANFIMLSSVSNKKITNRAPSDYLKDVAKAAGDNLDDWLARSLISPAAFQAALEDDFKEFVNERSMTIDKKLRELAAWP